MVAVVALFVAATTACSVSETMPMSDCVNGGSSLIVAQSVPTADYVPCLDPLPAGWEKESVEIDQDGTVMTFNSDRAGSGSRLHR